MANISGTANNDSLSGTASVDTLSGNGGDDRLRGGRGADRLEGGSGTDTADYLGDFGAVWIDLAAGTGRWNYAEGDVLVSIENAAGTDYGDWLYGSAGVNRLVGNGGDDRLHGRHGADSLDGGAGTDTADYAGDFGAVWIDLTAGTGRWNYAEGDTLAAIENVTGTQYGDRLYGSAGVNRLLGNGGDDLLHGRHGADSLDGGTGIDTADYAGDFGAVWIDLAAGTGRWNYAEGDTLAAIENVAGTQYGDRLYGSAGVNRLVGNGGDDLLHGRHGADALEGGAGTDTADYAGDYGAVWIDLAAGIGRWNYAQGDTLAGIEDVAGTEYGDRLIGSDGVNRLVGNGGDDLLHGGFGADRLEGGAGTDTADYAGDYGAVWIDLAAGTGRWNYAEGDLLLGIENAAGTEYGDRLFGTSAANRLVGNGGNDTIGGGGGGDWLDGGRGADTLTGGAGSDRFAFTTPLGAGNVDRITDLEAALDRIVLGGNAGEAFAALASGQLAANAFITGTAALDANDHIIYNSATGALLYDADGSGAGAAVQFATLSAGLTGLNSGLFEVSGPLNHATVITSGGSASIVENSPAGAIVYQTVATDADGDRITYSLAGADAAFFTIDAAGAVRLISSPDFETRPVYDITVLASDSGLDGASRAVRIDVQDVEDSPPTGGTPVVMETSAFNNSVSAAQVIARGTLQPSSNANLFDDSLPSITIRGSIATAAPNADLDFYAITLSAGERLILDIDNSTGSLDALVRIYDASGNELGFVDDSPVDPGSDVDRPGTTLDSFLSFRASTAGTYYFSVESWGEGSDDGPGTGETTGSYNLHVSIGPAVTQQEMISEDIDALIGSNGWPDPDPGTPGTNLTFAFPNSPSDYPAGTSETQNNFESFNTVQQIATSQMLQQIAGFADITFTRLFDPQESGATLRFAMSDEPEVAYAYLPGGGLGGTAWFRNSPIEGRSTPSFDNPVAGGYAWMSILHEAGHALGLKHGHEFPAISFGRDSVEFTMMTYRSYVGNAPNGYRNETWGFPSTPMMLDIAALQRMYGANFNFNAGNTVYSWSPDTGQFFVNGVGGPTPGGNRVFMTVWDGGGNDTYDFSNYSTHLEIDLRPGEWTTTSQVQLANLGDGNRARGNIANALLFEGDPRSLIENVVGGSTGDTIIANQASNRLTGGGGEDWFLFHSLADASAAAPDTITDFVSGGGEKIGLEQIDANINTQANEAFSFIGPNAFSGTAGQLRYDVVGDQVHIFGDVDGDAVADLHIIVDAPAITIQDFFL